MCMEILNFSMPPNSYMLDLLIYYIQLLVAITKIVFLAKIGPFFLKLVCFVPHMQFMYVHVGGF